MVNEKEVDEAHDEILNCFEAAFTLVMHLAFQLDEKPRGDDGYIRVHFTEEEVGNVLAQEGRVFGEGCGPSLISALLRSFHEHANDESIEMRCIIFDVAHALDHTTVPIVKH